MHHRAFVWLIQQLKQSLLFTVLWFCWIAVFSIPARAAMPHNSNNEGLDIRADNISRDYETHSLLLEGHVHIRYELATVDCDKATVSTLTHQIIAQGHVILDNPDTYIEGDKIEYNYVTRIGEIDKGSVESGNVIFFGDKIKKNSDKDFVAKNAEFTACVTCPPAWSFSGSEIDAQLGGYAYIKYPILKVAGFPVFFFPRIMLPLKSARQSGVLVPTLSFSSSGGSELSLPYFWAISKSQDATFTLINYQKLGIKEMMEYRYVLDKNSHGELHFAHIRDRGFSDTDTTNNPYSQTLERGFLTYDHIYELPHHYVNRVDLSFASDLRYPRDYYLEMPVLGNPALENNVSITKNTERQNLTAEASYYVNLLKQDATAPNNDAVHRFPEINYSLIESEILHTNLFFKFDFNYINFARRDFSYDTAYFDSSNTRTIPAYRCDPNVLNCASFDPTVDQIRTGQRFIFKPSISYPFHIGNFLDVEPRLTYGEMQYRFNASPDSPVAHYDRDAARRYLEADISAKTKYSRVYGPNDGVSPRYKHEIEPEIVYSRIPWEQDPDNLFFGSFQDQPYWRRDEPVSNSDFTGQSKVQFDYLDRFFNVDYLNLVLSNYVTRKTYTQTPDGPLANYFKFFTFRVSEGYDFHEAQRPYAENPHPWAPLQGLLDVKQDRFETNTTTLYYPYARISNWASRVRYTTFLNNFLEVVYADNYIVDESFDTATDRTQTVGFGLGLKTKYLNLVGHLNYLITSSLNFQSEDYQAEFKLPGDCLVLRISQTKNLGSDQKFGISFNFKFGG